MLSWESKVHPPKLPLSNKYALWSGTINHWFPLIRPAIRPGSFLGVNVSQTSPNRLNHCLGLWQDPWQIFVTRASLEIKNLWKYHLSGNKMKLNMNASQAFFLKLVGFGRGESRTPAPKIDRWFDCGLLAAEKIEKASISTYLFTHIQTM